MSAAFVSEAAKWGAVVMLAPDRTSRLAAGHAGGERGADRPPALAEAMRAGDRDRAVQLLETELNLRFARELAGR